MAVRIIALPAPRPKQSRVTPKNAISVCPSTRMSNSSNPLSVPSSDNA
jgi:hypothetical protein